MIRYTNIRVSNVSVICTDCRCIFTNVLTTRRLKMSIITGFLPPFHDLDVSAEKDFTVNKLLDFK